MGDNGRAGILHRVKVISPTASAACPACMEERIGRINPSAGGAPAAASRPLLALPSLTACLIAVMSWHFGCVDHWRDRSSGGDRHLAAAALRPDGKGRACTC
jgi:hypothetical protein